MRRQSRNLAIDIADGNADEKIMLDTRHTCNSADGNAAEKIMLRKHVIPATDEKTKCATRYNNKRRAKSDPCLRITILFQWETRGGQSWGILG